MHKYGISYIRINEKCHILFERMGFMEVKTQEAAGPSKREATMFHGVRHPTPFFWVPNWTKHSCF